MKSIGFILIIFLFGFGSLYSQQQNDDNGKIRLGQSLYKAKHLNNTVPDIIPEFFILGTLSDYMGRFQ